MAKKKRGRKPVYVVCELIPWDGSKRFLFLLSDHRNWSPAIKRKGPPVPQKFAGNLHHAMIACREVTGLPIAQITQIVSEALSKITGVKEIAQSPTEMDRLYGGDLTNPNPKLLALIGKAQPGEDEDEESSE